MKSRLTGVLIGQIIGIVIVCMISTFIALVSFGGIAGVTMASNPEQIFQSVAPLSCPDGTMKYEEYTASYNRPGESNFYVECVAADGTTTDITLQSIGYSLLGFLSRLFPASMCSRGIDCDHCSVVLFAREKTKNHPQQAPLALCKPVKCLSFICDDEYLLKI